jgi:hypothetical protein
MMFLDSKRHFQPHFFDNKIPYDKKLKSRLKAVPFAIEYVLPLRREELPTGCSCDRRRTCRDNSIHIPS